MSTSTGVTFRSEVLATNLTGTMRCCAIAPVLGSTAAGFITGAILPVDGGYLVA